MFLYTLIEAIAAVVLGILIAVRAKRTDSVVYSKLDRVGVITNILLAVVYAATAPFYLFLGMISYPACSGFMGIICWIVTIINASAALFCGLGLGYSVALRKKGKSKLSFAVQFAGVIGICLTVVMYALFAGNLLESLN